jgi:elongation factor 1-gamma
MSLSLWYPHGNGRAAKVLIAAEIAGIALEHKNIEYENLKTPEFLAVNPFGRVPTLETPEGPIFESFAILRYIARKSNTLFGKNAWEQAQIENWLNLSLSELDPFVINYVCSVIGYVPLTKDRFNQITKTLKDWAKSFDEHLNGKSFIVGDSLSIADVSVASYFFWLFRLLFEEKNRAQLPNVLKWYESVSALPQFQSVLGKTWYAQKEFTPVTFVEEE